MLRLASLNLRADGMKDSCLYWAAPVVIKKLWNMREREKPARRVLVHQILNLSGDNAT